MKQIVQIFAVIVALISFSAICLAEVAVPTPRGEDLLVPDSFINTQKPIDGDKVVAVFHDRAPAVSTVEMRREGDNWVIPGGVCADVHPAVVSADGKRRWCKIEEIWDTGASFVKWRKLGPSLNVCATKTN